MTATLIDGKALAEQVRAQVAQRAASLTAKGMKPGLAVIIVGDDPASHVYVRNKHTACQNAGMHSVLEKYPADLNEQALMDRIAALNADATIHGILVQLPLPKHINSQRVLETIAFDKDVDGLHATNAGLTLMGTPMFRSCTPYGVMKMLEHIGMAPAGKHAVVVGRSNMVGKPMAMLLLNANATVSMCHSKTPDLGSITRQADILIAAAGREKLITADMVKPGAIVIDVGTNRNAEGKLVGDVDFAGVSQVAGAISPVPGGVGPMTIAMLLVNTIESAERALGPRTAKALLG